MLEVLRCVDHVVEYERRRLGSPGQRVQAYLYSRRQRLWNAYNRDGRAGARFLLMLCVSALVFFHSHFSRSVWGAGGASASLLSAAALVVYIQAESERVGFVSCVFSPLYLPIYNFSGVWGGQGVQAPLHFRRRRLRRA